MPPPSSKPRTNSLAFAKTDCHTCAANQRRCDRKRPRCSSCSGKNIVCGGYPMQLTWSKSRPIQPKAVMFPGQTDDPFHLEPLSLQASIHFKDENSRSRSHRFRKIRFVAEEAPSRKQPSSESCGARIKQDSACTRGNQAWASIQQSNIATDSSLYQCTPGSPVPRTFSDGDHAASPSHNKGHSDAPDPFAVVSTDDFSSDLIDWWSWSSTGMPDIGGTDTLGESDYGCNTVAVTSTIENAAGEYGSPTPIFQHPQQNLEALGSPILHESLFDKFETLLHRYDQDFCVVPLSGDVSSNPFRCQLGTSSGSQSLLHAILAVSCYHAGRQENKGDYSPSDVVDHHTAAVTLYRNELDTYTGSKGVQLLDTTMVLFLFNATHSAFSNWATRISDARELLRLSGEARIWGDNRRVQAQVVMLLWWDATIALLSRQGCLLPYSYFEALSALEDDRYWSFFDLTGCPRELVVPLMQLASLAGESQKVLSMDWTTFDLTLVDEVQASIINWKNPGLDIACDDDILEEQVQQQRDRWNCTEAWRYGLLIYITRVFRWNRDMRPPPRLAIYARLILEHVHSCRHTATVQKQAFLPLFFAGCETKDQFSRQSIRYYCQYWSRICGYNLFSSASLLLEDVWLEQDGAYGDKAWWGSVIDKKQQPYQSHKAPMQFCFG